MTTNQAATRVRVVYSWRKRVVFAALIGVASLVLLELLSYVGIALICQFTVSQLYELRHESDLLVPAESPREVTHPYLGWVLDADSGQVERYEGREYPVNEFGLVDTRSPLQKRAPDKVIVAVIGGSVAWQATVAGNELLLRELQKIPRFQGRDVVLVRLAMNAYKQPQQLLLLTYLLSLGAEFDVVINIDGYNETALHPAENGRHDVFPPFPRAWKARNLSLTDPDNLAVLARLSRNKARLQAWNAWCRRIPGQRTATINFLWKSREGALNRAIQQDSDWLVTARIERPGYQITGPLRQFDSPAAQTEFLVRYWQDCSRQMELLCRAHGIEYHHVLPPNQHLEGSKPMGATERAKALKRTQYSDGAIRAYPLLVQAGAELAGEGIHFHDLTQLFQDHPEPIYADDCCHYYSEGSALLAIAIVRRITNLARRDQ